MPLRFRRVKESALTGETVVRYTLGMKFEITVSKAGLAFSGDRAEVIISDQNDLQDFAKVVTEAWADHRKLVPNLMADMEGQLPLPLKGGSNGDF